MLELGSSLRLAREAQGLTLADAEKATRVRARYLRALEDGQLDQLPGGSYPRVFLRDYASYLGLDPTLLLEKVPEPEPEISPQPVGSPLRPLPWRGAVAAALVLACAAAASFWALSPRDRDGPAAAQAARSAPAAHPAQRTASVTRHPVPAVAVLTATRGDCWVRVSRGDRVVWTGTLRQGRTLKLGLAQRLVVRLGAPWNVDARVAGRALAPFPHAPTNVVLAA